MSGDGWSGSYFVEGEPSGPNDPEAHGEYGATLPGFFETLSIPLVAGRDFQFTDVRGAPSVVIVDAALAKRHWGSAQNAIGKRLNPNRDPGMWATVIGVVAHVHRAGPQSDGEPQIYVPHGQSPQSTLSVVARGNGAASALAPAMRAAVRSLDAEIPLSQLRPMDDFVARALAKLRFDALLLGIFAVTALVLASVGLYGVMAYLVSQRTREIGIRMALGGEPRAIRRMVLREGILISVLGLVVGGLLSLAGSRAVSGLLFGVTPTDAVTYGSIAGLLLIVGAAASYGPARRATRVDPLIALRDA
jgi:predicted permease